MKFFATEPRRSANIAKHGFDPADFEDAFSFDDYLTIPTCPSRTGRERLKLIGTWFGEVIVSPLGSEATDVVSVRSGPTGRRGRAMPNRDHAPGYVPNDAYTQEDWDEVSDNPPLTDEELASARRGPEGLPPVVAEAFRARAGRPRSPDKAVPVSLRVPPDVLAAFKADGPGWQTRMNEALANAADGIRKAGAA